MGVRPLILSLRFVRLIAAWADTIFWSSLCVAMRLVGARRRAWSLCSKQFGTNSCRILGVHCHVVGAEHLAPGALFAQNHDSFSDVFTVPAVLPPGTRFVVKQELSKVPFFGWGAGVGVVWVKREDRAAATASLATSLDELPPGWSMFIFPEGTRSKDGQLGPFKKGVVHMALQSRRPVVPIGTYGSAGIVPPGGWLIRSGPIELTVGAPIDTGAWSLEHLDEHLAELRAAIVALQAESRARYEAKYGALTFGGASTLALELRGTRAGAAH